MKYFMAMCAGINFACMIFNIMAGNFAFLPINIVAFVACITSIYSN